MSDYKDLERQCCNKVGQGKGHEARCRMGTKRKGKTKEVLVKPWGDIQTTCINIAHASDEPPVFISPVEGDLNEFIYDMMPFCNQIITIDEDTRAEINTGYTFEPWMCSKEWYPEEEKQVGGDHYKEMGIQPKDFCDANMTTEEYLAALRWNVQKYTWRKKDSTVEDFKKAIHYLEMGIERLEKDKAEAIKRGEFF